MSRLEVGPLDAVRGEQRCLACPVCGCEHLHLALVLDSDQPYLVAECTNRDCDRSRIFFQLLAGTRQDLEPLPGLLVLGRTKIGL